MLISKSKLILCEYNAFYFSEIAVIGFTVHEIKQGIVFWGTPGSSSEELVFKWRGLKRKKKEDLKDRDNEL